MGSEIAVMPVGVDPQHEFLGVGFGVKLGGVHVLADAEHLYRAITAGQQQDCPVGGGVDGLLVAEQDIDLLWKTREQFVPFAFFGDVQRYAAHGFSILRGDTGAEVCAQQAVAGAGAEKREVPGNHLFQQPVEIGLDLFLDAGFLLFGGTDIERAAAGNDGEIIIKVQIVWDAVLFDAHSACVSGLQSAVFEETGVFAVGGHIFRPKL